MLAVMGLLPWTATVKADKMSFAGRDLLAMDLVERRKIIGKDIAMIFQEPMASSNSLHGRLPDRGDAAFPSRPRPQGGETLTARSSC